MFSKDEIIILWNVPKRKVEKKSSIKRESIECLLKLQRTTNARKCNNLVCKNVKRVDCKINGFCYVLFQLLHIQC